MNNLEMCQYIEKISTEWEFKADKLVKDGNGQNTGGYIKKLGKQASQKEHFLSYYKEKSKITYAYLRCPQLIIFIAEVVKLDDRCTKSAISLLKEYDLKYSKDRDGNYMWGTKDFRDFKKDLQYAKICSIIKNAKTIEEVIEKVEALSADT